MELTQATAPVETPTTEVENTADAPEASAFQGASDQKPTPQKPQKVKVKVNGKEDEIDVDSLVRDYQKYQAGEERLRQAAEREKVQRAWLAKIKEDPSLVFKDLEMDADDWAERRLLKKIEYEMMSPEAKEAYQARQDIERVRAEKARAEDELKNYKEEIDKTKFEQLKSDYASKIDKILPEFYKSTGKTATPERLEQALNYLISYAETHGEIPDEVEALKKFEDRWDGQVKAHLQHLPTKEVISYLSAEQLDGIRKHHLDELRQTNPLRTKRQEAAPTPRPAKGVKQRTEDFFKKLEEKYA
jgi:hypothetical protein